MKQRKEQEQKRVSLLGRIKVVSLNHFDCSEFDRYVQDGVDKRKKVTATLLQTDKKTLIPEGDHASAYLVDLARNIAKFNGNAFLAVHVRITDPKIENFLANIGVSVLDLQVILSELLKLEPIVNISVFAQEPEFYCTNLIYDWRVTGLSNISFVMQKGLIEPLDFVNRTLILKVLP